MFICFLVLFFGTSYCASLSKETLILIFLFCLSIFREAVVTSVWPISPLREFIVQESLPLLRTKPEFVYKKLFKHNKFVQWSFQEVSCLFSFLVNSVWLAFSRWLTFRKKKRTMRTKRMNMSGVWGIRIYGWKNLVQVQGTQACWQMYVFFSFFFFCF